MITQFVVQETGNKATIYALDEQPHGEVSKIQPVATLVGSHAQDASWAATCMNHYLSNYELRLSPIADRFHVLKSRIPQAVWQSVASFLSNLPQWEPGSFDEDGEAIREVTGFYTDSPEELAEPMRDAYSLNLGIRIANAAYSGKVEWVAAIRSNAGIFRNDLKTWPGERRTWPLPAETKLLKSHAVIDSISEALEIAAAESNSGRRVRIHLARPFFISFEEDDDGNEFDEEPDHYWVVDVFDAPVPDRFTESGDVQAL